MQHLRFPIGEFSFPENVTKTQIQTWIAEIKQLPSQLSQEVLHLSDNQLDTPYRPEGWTIRQVVHHLADSSINGFIRFKLALTEENPTIKPYLEQPWAELPDAKNAPIAPSLQLMEGLYVRWLILLENLSEADLQKTFIHPDHEKQFVVVGVIALYAWHGKHHLAHIVNLKKEKGWK